MFLGSKVGSYVDRVVGVFLLVDGLVLVKGMSIFDRGLLNVGGFVDVVGGIVIDNVFYVGGFWGWVVSVKVFNYVVFDKRVFGLFIDG